MNFHLKGAEFLAKITTSLTHTLHLSNIISTATTEDKLDQTIFGQNSELSISSDYLSSEDSASSDSDSE